MVDQSFPKWRQIRLGGVSCGGRVNIAACIISAYMPRDQALGAPAEVRMVYGGSA